MATRANLERAQQGLVDAHHRTRIVELATVVWCGEERDEQTLREELVSVLNNLHSKTKDDVVGQSQPYIF
jgi:hypothetical protein